MSKQIVLKRSVVAVALTLASSSVVLAQQVEANTAPVQKVFVTGSNIKRADKEGSSPVATINRKDIEATEFAYRQKQASTAVLKFFVENQKIMLYRNVAVVSATGWSVTTKDGQERRGRPFRSLHVWEKRDGRWQLVVDQVTGA